MKKRMVKITMWLIILLIAILGFFLFEFRTENQQSDTGMEVVTWNETEQLLKKAIEEENVSELPALLEKVEQQKEMVKGREVSGQTEIFMWPVIGAFGLCIIFVIGLFGYIYHSILRPFDKMKVFAQNIAAGNFDMPLAYERSNYFGDFTWAFDSMRREVTKARAMEREAIENNKVVIATLSHDIKTPIASIRAYAEGLEANLDHGENRRYYMQVIMKKCDEVAKLTNDLFLHSIADLEKLQMELETIEVGSFMREIIGELNVEKGDILLEEQIDDVFVMADRKRLEQVMENLINNARKYAQSEIEIKTEKENKKVLIKVRDHGKGIPDADMPFIFDKFYRGKNSGDQQGSGLGLYIVRYIMRQSKGEVLLHNHADGLEVTLELPIAS